jgi:hypothetical protein
MWHDAEDFSGSLSYDDLISHWARFCYRIVVLAIRSGVARAASRPSDRSNSLRDVQTSTDNSAIIPRLISGKSSGETYRVEGRSFTRFEQPQLSFRRGVSTSTPPHSNLKTPPHPTQPNPSNHPPPLLIVACASATHGKVWQHHA